MKVSQISAALIAAALLLTLGTNSVAQNVHYRWLDDRGNPVHSDRPPPKGIDYEVVETGSTLVRQVDGDAGAVPAEVVPRVGNEFDPVDLDTSEQEEKNPELCAKARENLRLLESSSRIRLRNDQGEPQYLSDEERDIEKAKANEAIKRFCE